MVKIQFSNKTKILGACMLAWVIGSAIIVVSQNWSIWIIGIPLIILFIPTFLSAVSDLFY